MIEAYGNIWDNTDNYDVIVITTNGYVKKNGDAVMGKGIALEAKKRFPSLPSDLGLALTNGGNVPHSFRYGVIPYWIATFPVKPDYGFLKGKNKPVPGWMVKADLNLIEASARKIVKAKADSFLMPRPGCGNGGLKWSQVKPVIENILDDRFTVMEFLP